MGGDFQLEGSTESFGVALKEWKDPSFKSAELR